MHQDSELQHSFGPLEVGFDFLPLETAEATVLPMATRPSNSVPMVSLDSTDPLPPLGDTSQATLKPAAARSIAPQPRSRSWTGNPERSPISRAAGEIWLEGDVILCACPDCRAPMSVRVWLMMAQCWQCGTSIELTDEQEREVLRLLEQQRAAEAPPSAEQPARQQPVAPAPPPAPRPISHPSARFRGAPPAGTADRPPPVGHAERPAQRRRRVVRPRQSWLKNLFRNTPAWLISLLVHLIALTLLALLVFAPEQKEGPFIHLSSATTIERRPGEETFKVVQHEDAAFDMPLPPRADLKDPSKLKALLTAHQDAQELRLDSERVAHLPDVAVVKQRLGRPDGVRSTMLARDPRLRAEIVTQEGGTTLTEAAVARGLRWMSQHQNEDGSWSLSGFQRAAGCNCGGHGNIRHKSPGTALAMLPFLGAGQTHLTGRYQGNVARGLRWMLENQGEDGDLRAGANGQEGMYTHGQAAIVLCEAFAMTGDEQLREPAQKAIDFIVKAQYRDGGWRYQPGPKSQQGDMSVVGWQLMALQSARAGNLDVPTETFGMADLFLDSCETRGGLYGYQRGNAPKPTMTAEALLCRMYLGWTKEQPGLLRGVEYLTEDNPPSRGEPNIYYWYYGTQTMHHFGGQEWERWNLKMRDILCDTQRTDGHAAGSWDPRGDHSSQGGRLYMTSLAVCSLEVYYRHLPIFRQIKLD